MLIIYINCDVFTLSKYLCFLILNWLDCRFLYLIPFVNQSLKCTEERLISSDCHQDVLKRINLMSHNPAEELGKTFDKTGMALGRKVKQMEMEPNGAISSSSTCSQNHDKITERKWLRKMFSTYKRSGILVHRRSSTHSFTEGFLDKLGRREVRKSLSQVHCLVVCSQLCEFDPVGTK